MTVTAPRIVRVFVSRDVVLILYTAVLLPVVVVRAVLILIIASLTPESLNGYPVFPGFALHDHFAIESGLRPAAKPSSQRAGAWYENAHRALV